MDVTMIILRLVHVIGGIFWVGAMFFVFRFLAPSIAEAGPDGGKVMAGITRRGFMQVMPVISILTLLSGIWLYWRASAGFSRVYLMSGPGHVYAIGGLLAIIAFILGVTVSRPAMMKGMALGKAMENASPAERETMMATAASLRARGETVGNVIAVLLILAAVAMAIGRYVHL